MNDDPRVTRFARALASYAEAPAFAAPEHRPKVLTAAAALMRDRQGMAALHERIGAVVDAGLLKGTPWERPERLVPSLVGGTLRAGGETAVLEVVSDLRMLALAEGTLTNPAAPAERARDFLQEIVVANLDLAFPSGSEAERELAPEIAERARTLFTLVLDQVPFSGVLSTLAREVRMILHQRPIVTMRARTLLTFARDRFDVAAADPNDLPKDPDAFTAFLDGLDVTDADAAGTVLAILLAAVEGPSSLTRRHPDAERYAAALSDATDEELDAEARALGAAMRATGLVATQHPVLLRHVADDPDRLATAMALGEGGRQHLRDHHDLVVSLIRAAVHPDTEQAVLGLAEVLQAGLLARDPVRTALERLPNLELHEAVADAIRRSVDSDLPPGTILLADALSVLGQPLGISQGWSPTCQSARGISLWSQYAPGKLLDMVITVAKSDRLEMRFETEVLDSSTLPAGLAAEKIDPSLDSVSTVLVLHLDRLYAAMMQRAAMRAEDAHKWVNPAMYGQWIPTGFKSVYDPVAGVIRDFAGFVRTFYAAFHPRYNGGHDMAYPSPIGLFVTSAGGDLLGFHAVSLLRVAPWPQDQGDRMRAYFLNPNAEGRQDWGHGVEPTVHGHGERPGESSLPFAAFLSRTYAYHFNPTDLGDLDAVPAEVVAEVAGAARASWGTAYAWTEAPLGPVAGAGTVAGP